MPLPTGTVTFLFTDVEGSTVMARTLGDAFRPVLEGHNAILRSAIEGSGGTVVRTEGDAFFAVFERAAAGLTAAVDAQRALQAEAWPAGAMVRVRMGLLTGEGALGGDDYLGIDVHRAARIAAAGNGGQVVVSAGTRTLAEGSLPEGVSFRSLGAHRLKDLDRPEELFDLVIEGLPATFPPIRTLETPTTLPNYRTSFVGRVRERAQVAELLGPGCTVTLIGPGGIGKTRLAVETADTVRERFPDGVHFVDLSPLSDATLVAATVATSLSLPDRPDQPPLETLAKHLGERTSLLVLDNFEQVIEAASFVADLGSRAPRTSFLTTSREPLDIRGEQRYPVEGLETTGGDAVALFVARGRAANPSFDPSPEEQAVIERICTRLDGLPLAIELAASRIALAPLSALADELEGRLGALPRGPRDLPARQRTVHDTIAWSYDLLDETERVVFRRLSVFAGGWPPEALQPVVDPDRKLARSVPEVVASLAAKSLARPQDEYGRARMLETIRDFASERLAEDEDQAETRERHAAYFTAMAEETEPELLGEEHAYWTDVIERDHDNLRAVMRWSLASGSVTWGLRVGAAIWRFWQFRGHIPEGRDWIVRLLEVPNAQERSAVRARALTALGGLEYWLNQGEPTLRAYRESLSIFQEVGTEVEIAEAEIDLGFGLAFIHDAEGAREVFARAEATFRELGDRHRLGRAIVAGAILPVFAPEPSEILKRGEEALPLLREAGDQHWMGYCLGMLGQAAAAQGDFATARKYMLENLLTHYQAGDVGSIAVVLDFLAEVAVLSQQLARALRVAGASSALQERIGAGGPRSLLGLSDVREKARESLDEDEVQRLWEEGRAMSIDQAVEYAATED